MPPFAYLFERFPSFTQTFCYREVQEIYSQGIKPVIYSIRRPKDIPEDCPDELKRAVRYLPEMPQLRAEIQTALEQGGIKRKAARRLNEWKQQGDKMRLCEAIWLGPLLRAQKITHVHTHFSGIAARTAYWLKEFYGLTYSFTSHANDMFCETGLPVSLDDLIREARFVTTVSDYSRAWLCERSPEAASKIHRVYNGIDPAPFQKAQGDPARPPRIVSVGRCIEKKGFPDLINACATLRDRGISYECYIIGGGPLEEELREQVARLGLQGRVIMTGPLPQEDVREILYGASIFALACAREADGGMDNLPTVIAEAMACSLPVVSTRLAGVPEMVVHGETGLLTQPHDAAAFADALAQLLTEPETARQQGEAGYRRMEEQFASAVTSRGLLALLNRPSRPWWRVWG